MLLKYLFKKTGVLGMNARNLLYIKPYNKSKAINFADSKLKTKLFLEARGIAVAKLLATIKDKDELEHFAWKSIGKSFVVKPNRGFGGEGILIKKDFKSTDQVQLTELKNHIIDIFDGTYSLSSTPDFALIEQVIEVSHDLADYTYEGLPDIRVIVHNLIPVMAMMRLPTKISDGKANVHQGGIGVGIDLATGETTKAVQFNRVVRMLPGKNLSLEGIKIPNWDEILLIAVRCQLISNLGFLAADICLDKNNKPLVLELNARGGLMIQIANLEPLRERLERVKGLKVSSPEKGVLIGKELFGHKTQQNKEVIPAKRILAGMEAIELINKREPLALIAKIDPGHEYSILDKKSAEEAGLEVSQEKLKVKFILGNKRVQTIVSLADLGSADYRMLIGKRDLKDFLIDPSKESPVKLTGISVSKFDYHGIDEVLYDTDKQIKLLSHLIPINFRQERKKFLADNSYNPSFKYPELKIDTIALRAKLLQLETDDSNLGILFSKKRKELLKKIALVENIGDDNNFTKASIALFGKPDLETLSIAKERLATMPVEFAHEAALSLDEVVQKLKNRLADYNLESWEIAIKQDLSADIAVGKSKTIFISPEAEFTPNRLQGTIAHEIETHILRTENGKEQSYKIFQRGLAGYLATEEGLAIYNQERYAGASEHEKFYWAAGSVLAVAIALEKSFSETFEELVKVGFNQNRAFTMTFKVKRGLQKTSRAGAFTKNYLYFYGKKIVEEFVARGASLQDLYVGKIGVEDIELVSKIPDLKVAKHSPTFI